MNLNLYKDLKPFKWKNKEIMEDIQFFPHMTIRTVSPRIVIPVRVKFWRWIKENYGWWIGEHIMLRGYNHHTRCGWMICDDEEAAEEAHRYIRLAVKAKS